MLKVLLRQEMELNRIIHIKWILEFYKDVGCDVEDYLDYVERKINDLMEERMNSYKFYLIEKGYLPTDCFFECDYDCRKCKRVNFI